MKQSQLDSIDLYKFKKSRNFKEILRVCCNLWEKSPKHARRYYFNFFLSSLICKVVYWCLAFALAWLLQSILVCLQFGKFVLSIVLCSVLQVLQFSLISIILSFCFYVYLYWSFILFLCSMSCECLILSMFITSLFTICKCSELCCCLICHKCMICV